MKKLLAVQVAALGRDFVRSQGAQTLAGCPVREMPAVFPAVTCTAEATFRTGLPPSQHGMVANGFFDVSLREPMFWKQSAALVSGPRFWDAYRSSGGKVGIAFFQQSLGEAADCVLSPWPIHKHGGGMIMDCYSQPLPLYRELARAVGSPFRLCRYWGPLASAKSSDWIAAALAAWLRRTDAPDLLIGYLPGLDYDLQRFGPAHPKAKAAFRAVAAELDLLAAAAKAAGYEFLAYGDYEMEPVTLGPVYPNRALRKAGLFRVRPLGGREYPDFYASRAYALPDHQVAMVYCFDPSAQTEAQACLESLPGVEAVLDARALAGNELNHPRAGTLVLVARAGAWFAYPWWARDSAAPDYASHVDIHNKPGYDPAELFFGKNPFRVSLDASRVRGSHGRPGHTVAWCSTLPLNAESLPELSWALSDWLRN